MKIMKILNINNIFYIISSNEDFSIIFYDLIEKKKVNEIKNAHEWFICSFRHYLDDINKRDLLLSTCNDQNNIKLWNINNFECLLDLDPVSDTQTGFYSACFLKDNNIIYIVTANIHYKSRSIKVFDFDGNEKKDIKCDNTSFISVYYNNNLNKNFILTGNDGFVKSYDYNENKMYKIYKDNNDNKKEKGKKEDDFHNSIIIHETKEIIKLIESSEDGNIRIWNFHSGILLHKINVNNTKLCGICLWDENYLFFGCSDNNIRLLDLNKLKIVNILKGHENEIETVKKINHPKYGEVLLSQSARDLQIKMWIKKK